MVSEYFQQKKCKVKQGYPSWSFLTICTYLAVPLYKSINVSTRESFNPSWPGGGALPLPTLGFFCRNFFLGNFSFTKTILRIIIFCITHYGKLSKSWFSTIFKKNYNGRADLPPPRSLCNSGSPDQLGLREAI